MTHTRGVAENREARASLGKCVCLMAFMGVTVRDMKLLRGPAIGRPDRHGIESSHSPVWNGMRPLRVMLDPALVLQEQGVGSLLKLTRHSDVVEFYDCPLRDHPELPGVKRVTSRNTVSFIGHPTWWATVGNSWHAVRPGGMTALAPMLFGHAEGDDPLSCTIAAETGSIIGCDVFLTTNATLLQSPQVPLDWKSRIGPISPSQPLEIVSVP